MFITDGRDYADIRLHDIGGIQSAAQANLNYLKVNFFLRKIIKTQYCCDLKCGQQSVPGFFVDLFYGRSDFSHHFRNFIVGNHTVVNADAFVEEMQMR